MAQETEDRPIVATFREPEIELLASWSTSASTPSGCRGNGSWALATHRDVPARPARRASAVPRRWDRDSGITEPKPAAMVSTSAVPSITSARGIGVSACQAHGRSTARDAGDSFTPVPSAR